MGISPTDLAVCSDSGVQMCTLINLTIQHPVLDKQRLAHGSEFKDDQAHGPGFHYFLSAVKFEDPGFKR